MEENVNPMQEYPYLAGGREFAFGGAVLLIGVLMCNFVLYGGLHLAFGITAIASILCAWIYLKRCGHRFGRYEKTLLVLCLVIAGGFGRSSDGFVKFVMLHFLFFGVNLALCLAAGKNLRSPAGALTLLDAFCTFYKLGIGKTGSAAKGLGAGVKQGGTTLRRFGAVGCGLLIAAPLLVIMVSLLMSADAAFEGLMQLLPEFALGEYLHSAFWGLLLGWILYSRGLALDREPKPNREVRNRRGMHPVTVNTVLVMVCLVYTVYLFSQLAYFSGGILGILPQGYTLAEYARRGFFEMSLLCAINLGLLCLTIWLIRSGEKLPRLTRCAGLFIGVISILLVITASAKMLLYIGSYGLTRLRVLTEVIMLWLALTTVLVTIRLFRPDFGYMKAVVLTAMVLGALVFWADVDTVVAGYNVRAYQSEKLETVDVFHISTLGSSGTPWLLELSEDQNPEVAEDARMMLDSLAEQREMYDDSIRDFRGWNLIRSRSDRVLDAWMEKP